MIVKVDPDLCSGCALCVDIAPELFEMEDDLAVAKDDFVPEEEKKAALEAAESCPPEAIIIEQ